MFTSMGQRNMLYTRQMLDLESERDFGNLRPDDRVIPRDTFGYVDHIHPVESGFGNSVDPGLQQYRSHYDQGTYYGNQFINFHNRHRFPNHDLSGAALPNFYPSMFHPTCGRSSFIPQNIGSFHHLASSTNNTPAQISVDDYNGRENLLIDNIRGSCNKRKNAEVVPGSYSHINGAASSNLSSSYQLENSGLPWWNAASFAPPEYQGNNNLQTFEGSYRNIRSSTGAISHQHESAPVHHDNYLLQGNNMGPLFQHAYNPWIVQPENIGDGSSSSWTNAHPIDTIQGRFFTSGAVEVANMGVRGYHESSPDTSSTFHMHPVSMPNSHHHPAHGQNMQFHIYGHEPQVPASYQYLCSNLHRSNANPYLNGPELNPRFPIFPSGAEMTFRSHAQLSQPALDARHRGLRILSTEDAAFLEIARLYGIDEVVDQHGDMRLDIDDMSYEELLALEEEIGDVNTGLTEECILQNLKMTIHDPKGKSPSVRYPSLENETCAVCQVEYMLQERIGTLDCGHYYHADCIKQWLLLKNLCPICKEPALTTNRKDG